MFVLDCPDEVLRCVLEHRLLNQVGFRGAPDEDLDEALGKDLSEVVSRDAHNLERSIFILRQLVRLARSVCACQFHHRVSCVVVRHVRVDVASHLQPPLDDEIDEQLHRKKKNKSLLFAAVMVRDGPAVKRTDGQSCESKQST